MRFPLQLAALVAVSVLAVSASAAAQTKDENYSYRFDDELLVGDTLASTPPLLRLRPRPPRVTLLRPRVAFVGELLKSVEAL
jgi:hypothetical protein